MPDPAFARLVALACHDLRTPLATVNGFAKTLLRGGDLGEREERFVGLIDEAAEQMADLLDLLGLVARIETGRYDPALAERDTLELARCDDARIEATGSGETIEADVPALHRSLQALAQAAMRHGPLQSITWTVRGRELELAPITESAAPVVTGEVEKDLGALIARIAIEHAGGSITLAGETLRVRL